MRIFLGHMSPDTREIPEGVSIAASHFSSNLLRGKIFDAAYTILPPMVSYEDAKNASCGLFTSMASQLRRLPGRFRALGPLMEQVSLLQRIPKGSELWLYNVTNLNYFLVRLLGWFKPSVSVYPIVLDFTPGQSDEKRVMRAYNSASGRIGLTTYERIAKHNFRCLPGVVPPSGATYPRIDNPTPTFLLSGVLGENISQVSKVIEAFCLVPEATLNITGVTDNPERITSLAEKHPNVTFHGKVSAEEYTRLLHSSTFLLSTRDPEYLENRCNFPSKIIEALLHNRAIISTISYPQIDGIRYFLIPSTVEGMADEIRRIASLPKEKLANYINQSGEVSRRFSTEVWRDTIEQIEKPYDYVYLTNTPSFYKLELCRRLAAEGRKILMVLLGYGSEAVNCLLKEEDRGYWGFDWVFISDGKYQYRDKRKTYRTLCRLMRSIRYKKILHSGWYIPEYILFAFKSPRGNNMVVCESSDFEVRTNGLNGWVKRRIIGRMSGAFPSGTPHKRLLDKLKLKGPQYITGSVGIFRKEGVEYHSPQSPLRFLYVGRLTAVKNLPVLIDCFNRNGLPLTIVGGGEDEAALKAIAAPNIRFTGFIANEHLSEIYESHDVFILPSLSEPWGLVVEEALYRGLPCIVSDRVGAGPDMVLATGAGLSFRHDSSEDLQKAIDKISAGYYQYAAAARGIDFAARDRDQVNAYHKALDD